MRILVINPALPRLNTFGACEQDRLMNIQDLTRLGHDVLLLTRTSRYQSLNDNEQFYRQQGIRAQVVSDRVQRWSSARLIDPALLDGAAWAYASPDFLQAVEHLLSTWKPDLIWCHASYLWPPTTVAARRDIPTVIRSVNYEPVQVLQEKGRTAANWIRYLAKWLGEKHAVQNARVLASISPEEQRSYQRLNSRARVELLPLRTLPALLRPVSRPAERVPLRVFFMGASYNVPHNAAALEFLVTAVVPLAKASAPGSFEFHVLGNKVPRAMQQYAAPDLLFDGYVESLDDHLAGMDIALAPSLFGSGMQQKVFEPLCRGFATITHQRALAGYLFEDDVHVLLADSASDFVRQLNRLRDPALRLTIGTNAQAQATKFFGRAQLDGQINHILQTALE